MCLRTILGGNNAEKRAAARAAVSSLSHMTLIDEIERVFAIELTTDEILRAKNVGEFIRVIEKRVQSEGETGI